MRQIENRTFDEISVGDSATLSRTLTSRDIDLFAVLSGDVTPVSPVERAGAGQDRTVAHAMWAGTLVSNLLRTQLPGPGTVYRAQDLKFHRQVVLGETVQVRVTVRSKDPAGRIVLLDCMCTSGDGETIVSGTAEVSAPEEKIVRSGEELPHVQVHPANGGFDALLDRTAGLDPIETAVVHPCDANSLQGALAARARGLLEPILVGPEGRIRDVADAEGLDLTGLKIVDAAHSHAAADRAVELVREGRAEAMMKGALHTDEIMSAVVDAQTGLRTERRMSHIFVLDVPSYPRLLMVTDAAINIAPDLQTKADIIQNVIELGQALGLERPKVAILSAVETITPKMTSTVEAAALCKMAERGQITGGDLDGPLAFDNAVSLAAARAKGIVSSVAGQADVLVAPDLEAGNMIAKQLSYLAGADIAGLVLGARVPIMLTSRADGILSRVVSAALAQLYVRHRSGAAPGTLGKS